MNIKVEVFIYCLVIPEKSCNFCNIKSNEEHFQCFWSEITKLIVCPFFCHLAMGLSVLLVGDFFEKWGRVQVDGDCLRVLLGIFLSFFKCSVTQHDG